MSAVDVLVRAFISGWTCKNYGYIWDLEEGVTGYTFCHPTTKVIYQTLDWNNLPLGMEEEVEKTWKNHLADVEYLKEIL